MVVVMRVRRLARLLVAGCCKQDCMYLVPGTPASVRGCSVLERSRTRSDDPRIFFFSLKFGVQNHRHFLKIELKMYQCGRKCKDQLKLYIND